MRWGRFKAVDGVIVDTSRLLTRSGSWSVGMGGGSRRWRLAAVVDAIVDSQPADYGGDASRGSCCGRQRTCCASLLPACRGLPPPAAAVGDEGEGDAAVRLLSVVVCVMPLMPLPPVVVDRK
ncbi:hypothetical protein ACLOJK_007315 [Asimina triloba]